MPELIKTKMTMELIEYRARKRARSRSRILSLRLCVFAFNLLLLLICTSCQHNSFYLEPSICYIPPKQLIDSLPSAFTPLSPEEFRQDWGRELVIANTFATELDFYRAITSYKRALILAPKKCNARRMQMEYGIVQSYYLANKYQDVIDTFESSSLQDCPAEFTALDDLLTILYDSYQHIGNLDKACRILNLIDSRNPSRAQQLRLSTAITVGDVCGAAALANEKQLDVLCFVQQFKRESKSVRAAQLYNAILPGAGYLYVGQKQTALTSLWLNSLFIASAYYFFKHHNVPAGLIMSSFEFGWYAGGINGAGLAAKEYNENLYNTLGKDAMIRDALFPVLMLQYTF